MSPFAMSLDPGRALVHPSGPIRVLVVDDSPSCRRIVREYLAGPRFSVDDAFDGIEALRRATQCDYDVVVSDLDMPGLDGFGLLEALKHSRGEPEVVLLTGSRVGDQHAAIRALRLGAHDFLIKPPPSAAYVQLAIERAAEAKRLRDANRHLLTELEVLARTDELTGLPNRRSFERTLACEIAEARRNAGRLCVGLVDLDHFKRINDTHGHAAGDTVLRRFAALACRNLRRADAVFRIGGEEFGVVLAATPLAGGLEAAARLLEVLRGERFELGVDDPALRVTASIGVAELDLVDDARSLLARADVALYDAKHGGRDQVRCQRGAAPAG